jgi:truncated hemoglobin YjbI
MNCIKESIKFNDAKRRKMSPADTAQLGSQMLECFNKTMDALKKDDSECNEAFQAVMECQAKNKNKLIKCKPLVEALEECAAEKIM